MHLPTMPICAAAAESGSIWMKVFVLSSGRADELLALNEAIERLAVANAR
jgi:hypothetical protein